MKNDWFEIAMRPIFGFACAFLGFLLSCAYVLVMQNFPASWVQVAVTAASVGVAIFVPWKQRQNALAEERRKERRKGLAIALVIKNQLRELSGRLDVVMLTEAFTGVGDVPKALLDHLDDLWLLGDAGELLCEMIDILQVNARIIARTIDAEGLLQSNWPQEQRSSALERLGMAKDRCDEVLVLIDNASGI